MSWSLDIGTIAGTVVRVHITFLLFLGWIFVASWVSGGADAAWQGLAFLLLLFACVLAHEFGHIFTADSSASRKSRPRNFWSRLPARW
jgi:Zn-dependent protease